MTGPPHVLDPADPRPDARARLRDWLALQRALALRPQEAAEQLRAAGDPRAALRAAQIAPDAAAAARDAATLRAVAAVALPLLSEAFPPRLARLIDPPPLLLVRGDPAALSAPGVAIVGARAASAYGLDVASALAAQLARAGLVVLSGLARGIDAAAHCGALDAGGRSVAIQACGPDRTYPAAHRRLAARIAERGAVVTEQPCGAPPRAPYFPLRNRLLSGAALAVVVVEARERSGSLVTAGHAASQGVDLFAVPGPVTAPTSAGTNRLLHEGAHVARDAEDVLALLEQPGGWRRAAPPAARECKAAPDALLDSLLRAPATRDELGRRLGWSRARLALELIELELAGRVAEDRDGRLVAVRGPKGRAGV